MDKEAIHNALSRIPMEWAIAFAARCAAQCLPGLLEKRWPEDRYFAFWPKKKQQQYLFAVLRANSVAYASSATSVAYVGITGIDIAR